MYARVSTWEGTQPDAAKQAGEQIRSSDGPPEGVPSVGITMLFDEKSGRSMAIALFETEDDLRKGDETLNGMTPPSGDGAGRRTSVDFYEVVVDRRLSGASA